MKKNKKKSNNINAPEGEYEYSRILSQEEIEEFQKLRRNINRAFIVVWLTFMVLVWTHFPQPLASFVSALWVLLAVIHYFPALKGYLLERGRNSRQ